MSDRYFGGRPPVNTEIPSSQLEVNARSIERRALLALKNIVDVLGAEPASFEELCDAINAPAQHIEHKKSLFSKNQLSFLVNEGFLEKEGDEYVVTEQGIRALDGLAS